MKQDPTLIEKIRKYLQIPWVYPESITQEHRVLAHELAPFKLGTILIEEIDAINDLLAEKMVEIDRLKSEIKIVAYEKYQYEIAAESWMVDCDKLKAKYEPLVATCQAEDIAIKSALENGSI